MGCGDSASDGQQRSAAADKTLEDLSQGEIHSAENIQADTSDAEFLSLIDGRRKRIKFPPACDKTAWKKLDRDLASELDKKVSGTLERKLEVFSDIIYHSCLEKFGAKEARPRVEPKPNRRQRRMEELRRKKKRIKKQMKQAAEPDKKPLREIWLHLKQEHSALSRAEGLAKRRRQTKRTRDRFFRDPFKFATGLFEPPQWQTLCEPK